jgi:hypothetical protein
VENHPRATMESGSLPGEAEHSRAVSGTMGPTNMYSACQGQSGYQSVEIRFHANT